ncbi:MULTISPECIES: MmcQ/YjbR family DNA-binding protein [unclassified Saccharopolyspora]|uniref:MmcQ/YjbR family DNA-binding protein n=1 Tax=unclassified Saccharopolyspora TaxID=2646250 RepID=UPI001CD5933C|nr:MULTISPECIES: MmcQ/YjbR family DNA-binding protein [unclassified Saccharopolyspora]MCA1185020.1 MmcQ/YjbR family DNA-binding protein [Saccharopolyspora sp. 6T]MCA1190742.1 MmcQ/YjbR family DNA-binding protein [Saccharopolyspora sp. 6V]MCA1226239.1 MmcQ/YjbR family DNA-binding protein [Saccharopolyspora sp. 6M]MCA1278206.1 MmcQ/YjbR family DNA-binding protein [Saccharopolyspora sp. 7B]
MTPHELKAACLAMPGAREEFPFDERNSVFKVAGKLFAISRLDAEPLRVSLKCEPDLAVHLRTSHPDAVLPGYHLNKRHWNTVVVNATVPDQHVRDLVEDSYDLVVAGLPRREREKLRWSALRHG